MRRPGRRGRPRSARHLPARRAPIPRRCSGRSSTARHASWRNCGRSTPTCGGRAGCWAGRAPRDARSGTRQFAFQSGVFVDASGRIYFTDVTSSRVVRVNDVTGAGWIAFGTRGSGPGQFDLPAGIAVDASGRIYVADASNNRIVRVSDMTGAGWATLGSRGSGPNQFAFPQGIFIDGAGRIYVSDALNDRTARINDM